MTDITALAGFPINNNPQPLNITFPDGSQLNFPVSGKASFCGDVEESAKVFFDSVLRHRDAQLKAERQRADDWKQVVDLRDSEITVLKDKLATPVSLPKAAYFNSSAENLPFFRAFQVIEAIHKVGFLTVTYED